MQLLRHVLALSFFFSASAISVLAQRPNPTDSQRDDLAGPVKSVSVTTAYSGIRWEQPGGPTLVLPVWCRECEYDSEGSRTKSGQTNNGIFQGEIIRLVRDANGHVTDRFVSNTSTGDMVRHEVAGSFGNTEQTYYKDGEPYLRQTFSYDQYGYMVDWFSFDGTGEQIAHVHTESDKDGAIKEKWAAGKDGQLDWRQTFDAKAQVESWTNFNQFSGVDLAWTVSSGKLSSFWELPDSPRQYGDNFTEDAGNDTSENYDCHHQGRCEVSRIHYEYLDPNKRNPRSAEWRDSDGNLRYGAYYEYEIDAFHNWIHRMVWVWSPTLGERTLLETDSRTITYWQK